MSVKTATTMSAGACAGGPSARISFGIGGSARQPAASSRALTSPLPDLHLDLDFPELHHLPMPVVGGDEIVCHLHRLAPTRISHANSAALSGQPCHPDQRSRPQVSAKEIASLLGHRLRGADEI